ncbi:MAG: family 78 glycoside hydrolase catalytic domain [Clostridia bacterium]|nr:family 78 glycoside hydrolase catalytic domain [Clostridia bacterium]
MALALYDLTCEYQKEAMGVHRQNAVFGWKMTSRQGAAQTAYRTQVTDEHGTLVWDSGKTASRRQYGIEMDSQTPMKPMSEYTFRVMVWDEKDEPSAWAESRFVTGVFRVHQWAGQWFRIWWHGTVHFYRHEFEVADKPIRYAYAYVASLGDKANSHVAYLNGKRLEEGILFPGATEYFRALYTCVDVKALLKRGRNAVGLVITKTSSMVMKIAYEDGEVQYVASARDTWACGVQGPYKIGYSEEHMQHGKYEEYDARKEWGDWTSPGFDDSGWERGKHTLVIDIGPLFLQPQYCQAKVQARHRPMRILRHEDRWFVDFGVNMAGFVSLRLQGKPGQTVEIRFAEKCNEQGDGGIFSSWRHPYLKYTFSTDGVEEYTPSFMYTGFRYVEIYGYEGEITEGSITAVSIHSDVLNASRFSCSDPMLERLSEVARRSFLSNMVNIPTDCPERERRGWTADAYAVCEAECVNFNTLTFYRQWLESMRDCQRGNGWIPVELPLSSDDCIDVNWPAAAVLVPYDLYIQYGDQSLIEEFYPMMCRWVELLENICDEEYTQCDAFMSYKDWLCGEPAGSGFLATAYFYRCADLLARMAAILEKKDDAKRYETLAAAIRDSIQRRYLHVDGDAVWYDTGSQSANAHALYFGICPAELRQAVTASLVRDIEEKGASTTGFMGTMCLMPALSQNGRADVAYGLLKNPHMGGWIYLLEQCDATTFPEHYNGGGSQNHAFLGSSPGLWIYKYLVGISPAAPGYERVRIAPYIPADMEWAAATVDTLYGPVSAAWRKTEGGCALTVSLPPNVSGKIEWNGQEYDVKAGNYTFK